MQIKKSRTYKELWRLREDQELRFKWPQETYKSTYLLSNSLEENITLKNNIDQKFFISRLSLIDHSFHYQLSSIDHSFHYQLSLIDHRSTTFQ